MMNASASSYPSGSIDRSKDPIWGTLATRTKQPLSSNSKIDSPRCGGQYSIFDLMAGPIRDLSNREKARLTSWLIEQRRHGTKCPEINSRELIKSVKRRNDMSVLDRADAVLMHIQSKMHELGQFIEYGCDPSRDQESEFLQLPKSTSDQRNNYYELLAHAECISYNELEHLLEYVEQHNWIKRRYDLDMYLNLCLTASGVSRLEEIRKKASIPATKTDSSRGFMAMWFSPSMNQAWQEGFKPGIREAGYEPVRVDEEDHLHKIDDKIIAEIRRSRFIVADFTGARGGVYYEAGFAHGLNIPVIFTCREDWLEKVHFDIRQYNFIRWTDEKLKKLQNDLINCITKNIGDRPLKNQN